MATNISGFPRGYSLTPGGLQNIPPFVINTNRAPATSDRANLGTLWNYINNNSVWMLTSATNGNYNWTPLTNNIGVISRLQAADGTIALPVAGLVAFPNTVITANTNEFTNILTSVQANNSNNFLINLTPEVKLRSTLNDVVTVKSVTNNNTATQINVFKSKGTIAAPLPVVATTELSDISSYGFDGTNNTIGTSIKSRVPAGGVVGANCVEAELVFSTSGSTAGVPPSILNERVVIGKDGLVTINTPTAPGSALIVNGVNTNANFSTVINASVAGGTHQGLEINNTNVAIGSSCQAKIAVDSQAAGTGGDPILTFSNIGGGTPNYSLGQDTSAQQFALSKSASLGTTNIMTVTNSNNQINYPEQCSFNFYVDANQLGVVGLSGTRYTPLFGGLRHNITGSYNPLNGRFTAPIAGRYLFYSTIAVTNLNANNNWGTYGLFRNGTVFIASGNNDINAFACSVPTGPIFLALQATTIYELAAGDTIQPVVEMQGLANTNNIEIGLANIFAGQLLS